MDIARLCREIGLHEEIAEAVVAFAAGDPFSGIQPQLSLMCDPVDGQNGYQQVAEALGDDPDGIKILACQLHCACKAFEIYQQKGIPEEIYFATMSCYQRFVRECMIYRGRPMFDRGWWTWRQISLRVFRLGVLEFELRPEGNVAMHIPGGTDFAPERVDEALELARAFIARFFPRYEAAPFTCHSWLLSPMLTEFLCDGSNIRHFQKRFALQEINPDGQEYISWLFQTLPGTPVEALPEDTQLQRCVKQFVLNGGKIGDAFGVLQ